MAGAGSPLDYEELKITRLNSTNPYSENDDSSPTDSETGPLITSFLLDNPPLDVMDVHNFGRGGYRYCLKCSVWKPDRSHHCSNENRCVLRMDHHCPWFSVCIGFKNQKFFVQFLFYVSLFCTYLMIISTVLVYYFIRDKSYLEEHISINLVVLLVLSFAFSFSVSIFAGFLAYLVLKNQTTIEFQALRFNSANDSRNKFHYEFDLSVKKLGNIYDLGYYKNWTSIMGEKWYLWIFPIGITSDKINDTYRNGINFTVDEEVYEKWCDNAKLQDQLNQQLAEYKKKKSSEIREPLM